MSVDHTRNIIELRDVGFAYGDQPVLQHVNLDIHRGDYLGIVGPNGAGKTTLLRIILGLLQPTTGTVRLASTRIGYVPQKATNVDESFPVTAKEVALMGTFARRGLFARSTAEDREAVRKALEETGMWGLRDRLIGDLSGGQQQRVFIARALAGDPEVIFLDEPTAGVDPAAQADFYQLLRRLNRNRGLTLVFVSHDIDAIARESMHIACVDGGLTFHHSFDDYLKDCAPGAVHPHHHHE